MPATPYDASNLFSLSDADIYRAPVGTVFPTDLAAPAAAWKLLGHLAESGIRPQPGRETEDIPSIQSGGYPVRRRIRRRSYQVAFDLMEWTAESLALAWGGGAWTQVSVGPPPVVKFTPFFSGELDESALLIDGFDGARQVRWAVPRGSVGDIGETTLGPEGNANLPVSFAAFATGTAPPWYLLSADTQFVA